MDMIHCHGYKEDLYGLLAARNCRRIATNHLWKCASWRSRAYARLDSAVLRGFHRIVGVSDEIVRTMHARGLGKAVKIANGVDCELFAPRTKDRALIHRYDLSRSGPVFGMASSLTSVKGHRYALHAFARLKSELPGAKLLIAGEGSERGAIEQTLRERGVADSVRLTGTIDNMPRFLSVIDMFVLPSLNEGLPMALLEAMASAKPVIAARVGEIPRVIDHGTTGLLIDPANEQDLYAGMRTLGRCRRLRRTMGARARQRVIEHYSSRRMTRAYADLYAAACGRKSH
jgi:glycosyltransferase involved in cell wall biosynthesis